MDTIESKDKKREYLVSAIGPLVGLLTTIITAFTNLPTSFKWTLIILLITVTLLSIYVVFVPIFTRGVRKLNDIIKHRSIIKKHFVEFEKLVDRFGQLINENRCDSIVHSLQELQNKSMLGGNLPFPSDFHNAYDVFICSMRKLPLKKRNFLLILRWYESIVNLTNKYLICSPVKEIQRINKGIVPQNCKNEYEECRLTYVRLLENYEEFARYLNKRLGDNIAREYFDRPVKL